MHTAIGLYSFVFHLLFENMKTKICRTKIFPLLLYGCETSSVTLREEHSLGMLKRDEVRGEWRRLHNEELHDCTPGQIFFR
jgi:hypothetical protein